MSNSEHYTYRVTWSADDGEFVGAVAEMPSLSWLEPTQEAAFRGIRQLVADVIEDMKASGETPPDPIADRTFSGKFQVRIPPELHRQLALEAAEQNVSLNRLASKRLVGA